MDNDNEFLAVYELMYKPLIKKIEGYTIYCDESMNLRKVRLKESLRNELKYKFFVIGGVEVPDNCNLDDIKMVFSDDNFPEVDAKYKYFSFNNSDFGKALCSSRLNKLFKFMIDNNIYIHINIMNYWYWAISDIVQSIVEPEYITSLEDNRGKVSAMYEALMHRYDDMFDIFLKFNFPNIKHGGEQEFILEILRILKRSFNEYYCEGDELYNEIEELIHYIERRFSNVNELTFIQDEKPLEIVSTLVGSYLQTAYMFKENGIIFDKEEKIVEEITSISPSLFQTLKCSFVDSKTQLGIQLSDVIAGFTARFFEFIAVENKVSTFFDTLKTGSLSFENCYLFSNIFRKSCLKYVFNYVRTLSIHQENSFNRFIDFMSYFR